MYYINRCLVSVVWFKKWKKYVGFDDWDKIFKGEHDAYPGPIDNSALQKGNLVSVYIFYLLPTLFKIIVNTMLI